MSQTLAEMRAYLDSYMRHGAALEMRVAREEELNPDERSLLCGRLIRLVTRLHVARERLIERHGGPELAMAEALLEQGRAAFRRAITDPLCEQEMDRKVDYRLDQLRFIHIYHELTGYYHDLLVARTELEAMCREIPEFPSLVLAREQLSDVDAALKDKHPRLEELWVGPFARLDDFAPRYPRTHWWWFRR